MNNRTSQETSRSPAWRRVAVGGVVAVTLAGLVWTGGILRPAATAEPDAAATGVPASSAATADRNTVEGMTAYLASVPQDWGSWSGLGQLQLEQARATADPTWFERAAESSDESMRLQPNENLAAIAGKAALAGGQHDFVKARNLALRALRVNPLDAGALGTLTDALTELGRYRQSLVAAKRLDNTRPGVSSFTRLAYQAELRGQIPRALGLLRRAAESAASPAQIAFSRYNEGLLAFRQGRFAEAKAAYNAGLAVASNDVELLHLSALLATRTNKVVAIDRYRELIQRRSLPTFAMEFADLSAGSGREQEVTDIISLVRESSRIGQAKGAAVEPSEVVLEARFGDPATAVKIGRELWSRGNGVFAADALAVALQSAGMDKQALKYANLAMRIGTKSPKFKQHRAEILAALRN